MDDDGDEFDMYLAQQHVNSLYYVSEAVINKAMLHELNPSNIRFSYDKLFKEIVEVHGLLLTFFNEFMTAAAGRHFVTTESNPVLRIIRIGRLPILRNLRLPFFVKAST